MPRLLTFLAVTLFLCTPAPALVGGATDMAGSGLGRHVVLIVGSRGNSCSGVALAPDLVLTVAHCVLPGAEYRIVEFDAAHHPQLKPVTSVTRHPAFKLETMLAHRATADVALLKLAAPLASPAVPAPLTARTTFAVGERFTVVGYGLAVRGDGKTGGTVRAANLVTTGHPGTLQVRLVDPATGGERPGLGACTGDSGAPAFEETGGTAAVVGLVSWSTGPNGSDGCGGLTGLTPLVIYRDWITSTARRLGSPLPP
ncbi:MAG: trypsin-like serine protease [Solirubrobacterales bacterium]|nr:trypsin-like serine protease [Solirubrobacterales bacterium]